MGYEICTMAATLDRVGECPNRETERLAGNGETARNAGSLAGSAASTEVTASLNFENDVPEATP